MSCEADLDSKHKIKSENNGSVGRVEVAKVFCSI